LSEERRATARRFFSKKCDFFFTFDEKLDIMIFGGIWGIGLGVTALRRQMVLGGGRLSLCIRMSREKDGKVLEFVGFSKTFEWESS